ncbi:ATP-dependent helicase [Lentibacillus jeotgali]|uniref:ATP-dependent helicase n=1 Tax=Lentibacillus jeotgali TaxID=558169 RepID=UPI00026287AE|nr:ATP-dependent helicase [Lentibacillus jeotgali]
MNDLKIQEILDWESSAMVSAGPGTGKTKLLIRKLEKFEQEGRLDPYGQKVLVLTFNKKASLELQTRIEMADIDDPSFIEVFTYHGLGHRILSTYGPLIGLPSSLVLFPPDENKTIIKDLETYYEAYSFNLFYQKYVSIYEEEEKERFVQKHAPGYGKALDIYLQHKVDNGYINYSDLISKCIDLLKNKEWLRRIFQNAYPFILVDEFQDTDQVQFELLSLIGKGSNVLSVADEDQVIYEFRGAEDQNIQRFIDVFNAKTFNLSYNYRSTNNIVQVANSLISYNENRKSKTPMHTNNNDGEKIKLYLSEDVDEEVKKIKSLVLHWIEEGEGNSAVLLRERANMCSQIISRVSKSLEEANIQYYRLKQNMIINDKVVKWVISALSFKEDPSLYSLAGFVIYLPGIGEKSVQKIYDYIETHGDNSYKDVDISIFFTRKQSNTVNKILDKLFDLEDILDVFDYDCEKVYEGKESDFKNKKSFYRNIRSLLWKESKGSSKALVRNYEYMLDISNLLKLAKNEVFIGTIHQVKGLQFDNVIIAGVAGGYFPKIGRGLENSIQEERRLFYVGITRAQKNLCIAASRQWYNPIEQNAERLSISPFLRELDKEHVTIE